MLIELQSSDVPLVTALFIDWFQFAPWNYLLSIVFIFSVTHDKRKTHGTHLERVVLCFRSLYGVIKFCHLKLAGRIINITNALPT